MAIYEREDTESLEPGFWSEIQKRIEQVDTGTVQGVDAFLDSLPNICVHLFNLRLKISFPKAFASKLPTHQMLLGAFWSRDRILSLGGRFYE